MIYQYVFAITRYRKLINVTIINAESRSNCVQKILESFDTFDNIIKIVINDTGNDISKYDTIESRRAFLVQNQIMFFDWFPLYNRNEDILIDWCISNNTI